MATRSCIMLKVRKEDIGLAFRFDKKITDEIDWDDLSKGEAKYSCCKAVVLRESYIGVYCHSDGYISYNGEMLKKHFNTYEKALNLILGGDVSFIREDGAIRHYANRKIEWGDWTSLAPKQANTKKGVYEKIDHEYAYIFDEEKGGWLVRDTHCAKPYFKSY